MKSLLALFGIVMLTGCTTQSSRRPIHDSRGYASTSLHAIGARSSTGLPTGNYRIVNSAGSVGAEGRFEDGRMDGKWQFFDSHCIKIAEVTYRLDSASGPYRTFFGSNFDPSAAGKLETAGLFRDGRVVGEHVAYSARGGEFSKAVFATGQLRHVEAGPNDAGPKTAAADTQLLHSLEGMVRSAVR